MSEQRTQNADERLSRQPGTTMRTEPLRLRAGSEPFRLAATATDFTLLDYWRWSGSDLLSNAQRGVMAEFLVARALGTAGTPRLEWGAFDVQTRKGDPIEIPLLGEGVHIFHAGSATGPSGLVTSGGRVLAVSAVAPDFAGARSASVAAAAAISFSGKHFRSDIGWREERRRREISG